MTRAMVLPSPGKTPLHPLGGTTHVTGGFWAERMSTNRERTIPHGLAQLEASGALQNFRNAARRSGRYIGGLDDAGITFPFLDSDVYKWLEAVGWELGREAASGLAAQADEVIATVEAAQAPHGYLGTFVQLSGREPYSDLQWGHELYCIGHLAQAAVAWQRGLGDERLLAIAARAIDHIEAALGPDGREGVDGHPQVEMALVELFRATGQERYLALARLQIERRGRGLLGAGRMGDRYWQDHEPVRVAPTAAGHAVRQLYLDCGVVDVAVETGDRELLDAVLRRWADMWATRTYITGALGSRHRDEAFGDAFELPSDRAYAETCAAIASVMLAWRLLLTTGEARFADAIERTLYNAVLPGLSLDGTHFFYSNPLRLRAGATATGVARAERAEWYPCACCPPNLMRTLSTFEQLIATQDEQGIQLHQFAAGELTSRLDGERLRLRLDADLPWEGSVRVTVDESPARSWVLALRLPAWCRSGRLSVVGEGRPLPDEGGVLAIERVWRPGDSVVIDLDLPPRLTQPDERIDAVRGCLAIERGPLVYCLEQADLPVDVALDDVELDPRHPPASQAAETRGLPEGVVVIEASGVLRSAGQDAEHGWPYRDRSLTTTQARTPIELTAIPYLAWANRAPGAMRVWIPASPEDRDRSGQDHVQQ